MSRVLDTNSTDMGFGHLPALRLARTPKAARFVSRGVAAVLLATPLGLGLTPWQQNIKGKGRVVAFDPMSRQQTIQSPLSGRVVNCWVIEGSVVKKGDRLVEIEDQDPALLQRLEEQLRAARQKLEASQAKERAYFDQTRSLEDAREQTIENASQLYEAAVSKVVAEEEALGMFEAELDQKRLDFQRQDDLAREGLVSQLKAQEAERDLKSAAAKVESQKAKVSAARSEERAKRADVSKYANEAKAKVDSAHALWQSAQGEVAGAEKEVAEAQVKVARQQTQIVSAPAAGRVFRLRAAVGAELLKAGDPLLELVPDAEELAVEMWIDGNDAPLVSPGRKVRLQFEGWPAVQFSGWPSVAVGTFGGTVSLVDAQDNGMGQFRILIVADSGDEPWPDRQYLRQGVRANGWVLLDQVSAGYEIWRIWNGFPPSVALEQFEARKSKDAGKS